MWYPLLCIKFIDIPIFLKQWRNAHEVFRHCETENFWQKNVITHIMHKNFRYPKRFEKLKGFPRKLSALWDKKFSREKRDTRVMRNISRNHNFSETLQGCSRIFSALWDHIFSTEKWDTPRPLIRKNLSKPEFFSKTVGFLCKKFRHCETNNFPRKIVTPLICIKFSDTRSFPKHWGNAHEFFRHCETKNFRRQMVTPILCLKFFDYPKHSETLKECLQSFRHRQSWNFWQKNVIPLICISFPVTTIFLTHCRDAHEDFRN